MTGLEMIQQMGERAREAASALALAGTEEKNGALAAIAAALGQNTGEILAANRADLDAARADGMAPAMLDRLALDEKRVQSIAAGVEEIIALPDPVGRTDAGWTRPNGLSITRVRVPLGVVGIIYEARPNVTADAAALCLKSGNACILRGGKEIGRAHV